MPQTKIISFLILLGSLVFAFTIISFTEIKADNDASNISNIQFPVSELGNCKNEVDCRNYCDEPKNVRACINFAEKHNLISDDELKMAKKFIAAGGQGPGGCASEDSCKAYCNDISHIDECIAFGEKSGIISPGELEEAKKVKSALDKGVKLPGGCRNKEECDEYCGNPENIEECVVFGEAVGFIPEEELEDVKKMLEAIKKGVKPLPCRGKEECNEYCAEPENFEMCINFAEAAGFISEDEAEMARKTGGKGPGDCRSKEACDRFCEDESNFEICLEFAEEHGFISEEDAEMVRKTGGKGPGNCRGKEECEEFCQNPENQEICFNFAKEHGLISEEDLEQMEEGRQRMMEGVLEAPPEVMECLNSELGSGLVEEIKNGTAMPNQEMGNVMRNCFEKMMRSSEEFFGPAGCKTQTECEEYCRENPEECSQYSQSSREQEESFDFMEPSEEEEFEEDFDSEPESEEPQSYKTVPSSLAKLILGFIHFFIR